MSTLIDTQTNTRHNIIDGLNIIIQGQHPIHLLDTGDLLLVASSQVEGLSSQVLPVLAHCLINASGLLSDYAKIHGTQYQDVTLMDISKIVIIARKIRADSICLNHIPKSTGIDLKGYIYEALKGIRLYKQKRLCKLQSISEMEYSARQRALLDRLGNSMSIMTPSPPQVRAIINEMLSDGMTLPQWFIDILPTILTKSPSQLIASHIHAIDIHDCIDTMTKWHTNHIIKDVLIRHLNNKLIVSPETILSSLSIGSSIGNSNSNTPVSDQSQTTLDKVRALLASRGQLQ